MHTPEQHPDFVFGWLRKILSHRINSQYRAQPSVQNGCENFYMTYNDCSQNPAGDGPQSARGEPWRGEVRIVSAHTHQLVVMRHIIGRIRNLQTSPPKRTDLPAAARATSCSCAMFLLRWVEWWSDHSSEIQPTHCTVSTWLRLIAFGHVCLLNFFLGLFPVIAKTHFTLSAIPHRTRRILYWRFPPIPPVNTESFHIEADAVTLRGRSGCQ